MACLAEHTAFRHSRAIISWMYMSCTGNFAITPSLGKEDVLASTNTANEGFQSLRLLARSSSIRSGSSDFGHPRSLDDKSSEWAKMTCDIDRRQASSQDRTAPGRAERAKRCHDISLGPLLLFFYGPRDGQVRTRMVQHLEDLLPH